MDDQNKTPTPVNPDDQFPLPPQPVTPPVQPTPATPVPTPDPTPTPAPVPMPIQPPAEPMPQTLSEINQPVAAPTAEPENPPQPNNTSLVAIASGFRSVLGAIFSWIVFPLLVVLILHNFVFQAFHVLGTSMYPTLHDSDYLIISKVGNTEAAIGRLFGKNDLYLPSRGQIIVFHFPKDPTKIFVKRVVGLPGDRVVVSDGHVTIFNKANPAGFNPDTKYEPSDTQTLINTDEVVQPGNLFVMGDNRTPGGSYDSREWGEVPSSYIIGNAVLRLLPLNAVKIL